MNIMNYLSHGPSQQSSFYNECNILDTYFNFDLVSGSNLSSGGNTNLFSQIFDLLTRVQNTNSTGIPLNTQELPRLTQQQAPVLPLQQTIKPESDVPLTPKIMSPNPYLLNEPVNKKVPARRNISETSLDFSLLNSPKKNPFDLGFGSELPNDFKIGIISDGMSSISKQELNEEEPLIGLVGEKRLKASQPELALYFNGDQDRLEILSLEEGPSATKRQRLD